MTQRTVDTILGGDGRALPRLDFGATFLMAAMRRRWWQKNMGAGTSVRLRSSLELMLAAQAPFGGSGNIR